VVEGSILRSGNRVRITAQLIRTATDHHIWAKAYEGDLKNVLSLQALVAEAITDEVKLGLTPAERNRFRVSRPVDPEAYEAYLRGRYFWNRRDVAGFQKAIEYFNQAIKKDPNFALAYSGLADCDALMALETLRPGLMAGAKAAALKALELDDGLAEAHTSLAAVRIFLDWDWTGSELEFKRALDLNPNYAPAHHWYGNILLGPLGRHEEAIAELNRARELDPLSLIINADVGYAYYLARQYDSAFTQYQKVLAMDRNFVPVHHDLLKYYAQKKMYDAWLQEEVADFELTGNPERAQILKRTYAEGGFPAVMLEMAESHGAPGSSARVPQQGSFCTAADAYAALQAKRQALAALQQCYVEREPGLIYLKVDPAWDSLRSEPAFQNLEHRIGLQ
jgi:tetratricopeptide (TPR) repeat protein